MAGAFKVDAPEVAPLKTTLPSPKVFTPVIVSALASVITVDDVLGKVIVVLSVPESVSVEVTESVLALVRVSVPVVVEIVKPFNDVAVATPRAGVTSVGDVARTLLPVPVIPVVPINVKSHDAAVVPLARIQETRTSLPAIAVPTKFAPDEFIVMLPVELL